MEIRRCTRTHTPPRGHARTWTWLLSVVLLGVGAELQAGELFKCMQADGVPSFQSSPCTGPERQVWVREVQPEPARVQPESLLPRPSSRTTIRYVGTSGPARHRVDSACASAREVAADERERRWNKLNMDDLRRLDAQVERACRRR